MSIFALMKAMIFAAGLGTRLRPLTDTRPKALVEVCGKPLIGHLIDKMHAQGISDITVNVHHFPDQIIKYLQDNSIAAHVSDERDLLRDTGGGILHARRFLEGGAPGAEGVPGAGTSGYFLVHNVDILSNLDFRGLENAHLEHQNAIGRRNAPESQSLATLVVSERNSSRQLLFDDDMRLKGWMNVQSGEIRSPFKDLNPDKCRRFAFAGIHMISDRIFNEMKTRPEVFPIMDFYLSVADRLPIYGYAPKGLEVLDVGKVDAVAIAADFLQRNALESPHD